MYFRWKVDKFQYTEKGVGEFSASGEYVTKQSWLGASFKIEGSIKKTEEYSSVLELLEKASIKGKGIVRSFALDNFVRKLIKIHLGDGTKLGEGDVGVLISNFLKDVKEEPLMFGAEVELSGIVIISPKIEFRIADTNISLRPTAMKDLEKEFPAYGFTRQPHMEQPSAIMDVDFLGRHGNEIQEKVDQQSQC